MMKQSKIAAEGAMTYVPIKIVEVLKNKLASATHVINTYFKINAKQKGYKNVIA